MANNEEYTQYRELSSKMDAVISSLAVLSSRVTSIEEMMNELNRTIRGHNGTPGMVTEVALIKETMKTLRTTDKTQAKPAGENITMTWLVEKLIMPLGLAFALWFLMTVLPQLLGQVNITGGG